jgi:antitoxin component of RelBE/YafQ-DinJ toxin-antitoxin module
MDGNYDATNIYFNSDLTITANVGVQEIDASGSKILETTGKSLKQVLDMILAARKLPSKNNPSVTLSSEEDNSYEVGEKITVSYSAVLNPGSYTYGPATNIVPSSWSIELNEETKDTATGTFTEFVVDDSTKVRISATAIYEAGAVPVDNLGEPITDADELLQCQIPAGNKTGYSSYISGYRKMFYGSKTAAVELNSANIRALTSEKASNSTVSIAIAEGAK